MMLTSDQRNSAHRIYKNQITIIVLFFVLNISTFENFFKKFGLFPAQFQDISRRFFLHVLHKNQIIFISRNMICMFLHSIQFQSENLAISSWYRCKHTYLVHSILPKQPCRQSNIPCTNPACKTMYHGIKGILPASSKYENCLLIMNQPGA